MEAKNEKSKTTLFSQTFEVAENKVPFFHFWPSGRDIGDLCFEPVSIPTLTPKQGLCGLKSCDNLQTERSISKYAN